jgi:hypothetical protein
MSDKATMSWTDLRGKKQTREIKLTISIEDFLDTAGGYPLLFLAANRHLTATEIEAHLRYIKGPPNERSLSWIKKRRKLFRPPAYTYNTREDSDGRASAALRLMAEHPRVSIRDLVVLLGEHGIERSREWVRLHRCDAVLTTDGP